MNSDYGERFSQLLNYYNHDRGIDLPAEPDERRFPYRAVCANIAWCMLDKDRFWEYYNKSDYWKQRLMMVLKQFGVKPFPFEESSRDIEIRKLLQELYGRKFILSCVPYEPNIDTITVYHILREGYDYVTT